MAERRMFAKTVVLSDTFHSMSHAAQVLYFHLCLEEKGGGSINNVRSISRAIEAPYPDCINELVDAGYVHRYHDGTCVDAYRDENIGLKEVSKARNNYIYRKWRKSVIKRDGCCTMCGSTEHLEAHHIKPFSQYPELRLSLENGITLCHSCHMKTHKGGGS